MSEKYKRFVVCGIDDLYNHLFDNIFEHEAGEVKNCVAYIKGCSDACSLGEHRMFDIRKIYVKQFLNAIILPTQKQMPEQRLQSCGTSVFQSCTTFGMPSGAIASAMINGRFFLRQHGLQLGNAGALCTCIDIMTGNIV